MTDGTVERRDFLGAAGAAGLARSFPALAAAEPPPETTHLRVANSTILCFAPQFVAEDLLRAQGFTQLEFIQRTPEVNTAVRLGDSFSACIRRIGGHAEVVDSRWAWTKRPRPVRAAPTQAATGESRIS